MWGMTNHDALRLSRLRLLTENGRARELRLAARLSLLEMAAACGVSHVCVSRWERDERRPRGAPALRYAALLDALAKAEDHRKASA